MKAKPKSDIAQAAQLFFRVLAADDAHVQAALKASTTAMMRCIEARGGLHVAADGTECVDSLVAEAVRDEIMDRARAMLLAKLGPPISKRVGQDAGEVIAGLINETFEVADREFPPNSPTS